MLGAVMLKRPWDDRESHNLDDQPPDLSTSVPESGLARSSSADRSSPVNHRLPPISPAIDRERSLHFQPRSSLPLPPEPDDAVGHRSSPRPFQDHGPLKRPRIHYDEAGPTKSDHVGFDASSNHIFAHGLRGEVEQQSQAYSPSKPGSGVLPSDAGCRNCSDTEHLIQKVVSGLLGLQADIREALAQSRRPESGNEDTGIESSRLDLRSSLAWACSSIEMSACLIREGLINRPSLPPIVANDQEQSELASVPGSLSRHILDVYEKERAEDYNRRYFPTPHGMYPSRLTDYASPSTMYSDNSRKGFPSDQPIPHTVHSPPPSVSGSTYGSAQSPTQMQGPHRTLPSPSSMTYPPAATGLPSTYSPSINQSVHNTHLQDLQHQISTKTLALQTLQREHDQLLAAFSRSQIRCATLDKKSQVSDHEINSLSEEKVRLQGQVEALESQVEELAQAKDEVHKQITADSAQWRQIVAMSSQLQAKGAEEAKRYKSDRESWERDRDGLQRRISQLESGELTLGGPGRLGESTISVSPDDILTSSSLDSLRAEIVRLRSKCAEMEVALHDLRGVAEQIDQVMGEFSNIRERITTQTSHGLQERQEEQSRRERSSRHSSPSESTT